MSRHARPAQAPAIQWLRAALDVLAAVLLGAAVLIAVAPGDRGLSGAGSIALTAMAAFLFALSLVTLRKFP